MAYTKHVWKNEGETGVIPIDKDNLNEMETGIANAYEVNIGTTQPETHEPIYVDKVNNKMYYWNGNAYVEISGGGGGTSGDTTPIGAMISWHSLTPPTNWLICDGSYVSKTTYADLYAAIGDTYLDGGTAPAGTFRLPDYKGRTGVGYDADDTDFNAIGKKIGSKELQEHYHELGISQNVIAGANSYGLDGSQTAQATFNTKTAGTGDSGNIQPSIVEVKIIKAFQSAGVVANVAHTYTESQTDTYGCDYVNEYTETETSQDLNKLSQISSKVEILNFHYKRVGKTIMLVLPFHINQALDNEETIALIDIPYISFDYYTVCRSASSGKTCTVTISKNSDNKLRLSSGGSSEAGYYYDLSITYLCD